MACTMVPQAFAGEVIEHGQHFHALTLSLLILHEVITPDLIRSLGGGQDGSRHALDPVACAVYEQPGTLPAGRGTLWAS